MNSADLDQRRSNLQIEIQRQISHVHCGEQSLTCSWIGGLANLKLRLVRIFTIMIVFLISDTLPFIPLENWLLSLLSLYAGTIFHEQRISNRLPSLGYPVMHRMPNNLPVYD